MRPRNNQQGLNNLTGETKMKKELLDPKVKRYHLYARGENELNLYEWLQTEGKRQDRSFNNMLWQAVKALKAISEEK